MGLLEELKTEVNQKREEEQQHNAEQQQQQEFYDAQLKPVMLRVQAYLSELVESLNTVAREVTPAYPLGPKPGQTITFDQAGYSFRSDDPIKPLQLDLLCSCTLSEPAQFDLQGGDAVQQYTDFLDSYKFPHHCRNQLDERHNISSATVELEGPMKVHIRVLAHPAQSCVTIDLRNLEDQPSNRYKFAPDKIDDELLDRLARLLVREESRLVEVPVSEGYRDKLRHRLELEKLREKESLAQAYAARQAERVEEEQNARLINRARRAMAGLKGGVLGVLSKNPQSSENSD